MSFEETIAAAVEAVLDRKLAPIKAELEALRAERATLVPLPDAARRLGVDLRTIQRWVKDGRLPVEPVGGMRMVRLPAGAPKG